MKTLRILGLIMIAGILFSCEKDIETNVVKQEVSFGITEIDPTLLKSDSWDWTCPDATPDFAEIEIDGQTYYPDIFYLNGKLYTQAIRLDVPVVDGAEQTKTYTVTKFLLRSGDKEDLSNTEIVMAVPAAGADFSEYVSVTTDFTITVTAFQKTEVDIEVLCFMPQVYEQFGFNWFNITEMVIREFWMFGDICANDNPYTPADFEGSAYETVPGGLQVDMPAIFKVHAYVDGVEVPNSPFSNLGNEDEPLSIRYPDKLQVDETFTFDLYVLVPSEIEGLFVYQLYDTYTTDDDIPLDQIGQHYILDFAIGNCSPWSTNEYVWLPAPVKEKGFGFRIKGQNTGKELYLGVADIGVDGNRVEMEGVLPDGTHNVTFSYDNTTDNFNLTVEANSVNYSLTTNLGAHTDQPCEGLNALEIFVHDRRDDGAIQWENVELNLAGSVTSLGTFDSYDIPGTTPEALTWYFLNDFTQSFIITADLNVQGLGAVSNVNELLKAEINIVCIK